MAILMTQTHWSVASGQSAMICLVIFIKLANLSFGNGRWLWILKKVSFLQTPHTSSFLELASFSLGSQLLFIDLCNRLMKAFHSLISGHLFQSHLFPFDPKQVIFHEYWFILQIGYAGSRLLGLHRCLSRYGTSSSFSIGKFLDS